MHQTSAQRNRQTAVPAAPSAAWRRFVLGLRGDERGDVPGWVMITLMSAVLVAGLLAVAGPALGDLFQQAIARVSGLG